RTSTLLPFTTLFRSGRQVQPQMNVDGAIDHEVAAVEVQHRGTFSNRPGILALRLDSHRPRRVPNDARAFDVEQPTHGVSAGFSSSSVLGTWLGFSLRGARTL